MMAKLPPAYSVEVRRPDGSASIFVLHGLPAARRELKAQQRLNPGCTVVLTKVVTP